MCEEKQKVTDDMVEAFIAEAERLGFVDETEIANPVAWGLLLATALNCALPPHERNQINLD